MFRKQFATRLTLWMNRCLLVLLAVLTLSMPAILDWYSRVRPLVESASTAIQAAFYLCVFPVALALWQLDRVLRNILKDLVFVHENVACLRTLRWCCLWVCLTCLPTMYFYLPLIFMAVIMGFLSMVINVVCQVMKAAVALREENDLTV